MPNKNYVNGRAREYKVMRELEGLGYICFRTAGSHGICDVIAFLWQDGTELPPIRMVQVKCGDSPYKKELEGFRKLKLPSNVQKEIWVFKNRQKEVITVE